MKYMLLLLLMLPWYGQASAEPVITGAVGVNGCWFDDNARPSDIEAGANAAASLSPHLSAVGGVYYGFDKSYVRASIGGRVTATDVNDQNFGIGVGIQRHMSSEPSLRPEEWAGDVSVGWKPWPESQPKLVLGVQGQYGFSTNQASGLLGFRYMLGGSK